jgi:hypothetical protein
MSSTATTTREERLQRLIDAAEQIVSEFIVWGEVFQHGPDEDGEYGPSSAVYRLAEAVNAYEPGRFDSDDGFLDGRMETNNPHI